MKTFIAILVSCLISIHLTSCKRTTETSTETTTRIPAKLIIEWEEISNQKIDWSKSELLTLPSLSPEIKAQLKTISEFNIESKSLINDKEIKKIYRVEFHREISSDEAQEIIPKIKKILDPQKVNYIFKGAETTTKKSISVFDSNLSTKQSQGLQ